jgi:hypothetical protein
VFGDEALNEKQAKAWINQAEGLIDQADELAGSELGAEAREPACCRCGLPPLA